MVDAFFDLHRTTAWSRARTSRSPASATSRSARKAPRPGRNPRTGEAIPIKARRVVTFHASHKLKEQIQGEHPADAEEFE